VVYIWGSNTGAWAMEQATLFLFFFFFPRCSHVFMNRKKMQHFYKHFYLSNPQNNAIFFSASHTCTQKQSHKNMRWSTHNSICEDKANHTVVLKHTLPHNSTRTWTQGLILASLPDLITHWLFFERRSHFIPRPCWTLILLFVFPHICGWDDRHAPLYLAIGWDGFSKTFCQGWPQIAILGRFQDSSPGGRKQKVCLLK
jgi:hypothetical protein